MNPILYRKTISHPVFLAILFALFIPLTATEIKAQSSPVGNIDGISNSRCALSGWAKDPDTDQPVEIHIYKDAPYDQGGTLLAKTTANLERPDLSSLYGSDLYHGFSYLFKESSLFDDQNHQLYVHAIDSTGDSNTLLTGRSQPIRCPRAEYFTIATDQPYAIGAWHFTGWARNNSYLIDHCFNTFGRKDVWCGVRDYANADSGPIRNPGGMKPDYSGRKPLINFYNLSDQTIMDAHIRQAASRGLTYFSFYWYWDMDRNMESDISAPIYNFLSSPEKNRLQFMIAPIGWTAGTTKYMDLNTWKTKVVPLIVHFVSDPSYLKTQDGRPIINDFDFHFPPAISSDAISVYNEAIDYLKNSIFARLKKYPIVTSRLGPDSGLAEIRNTKTNLHYEGFQCFQLGPSNPSRPESYDETLSRWQAFAENFEPFFNIPCASTGYDNRIWRDPNSIRINDPPYNTEMNPQSFANHLRAVKRYLDRNPIQTSKALTIYAWNEWGESANLEPSARLKYAYLDKVKEVFGLIPKYTFDPADLNQDGIIGNEVPPPQRLRILQSR